MKKHNQILLLLAVLFWTACQPQEAKQEAQKETLSEQNEVQDLEEEETLTLTEELTAKREKSIAKASQESKELMQEALQEIVDAGILDKALNVGDKAPNFELKNAAGQQVSLQQYLDKGAVILTWYRGGWCPYCNLTLQHLQRNLPDFQAKGASLIALSPETSDNTLSTKEKHQLEFEVLTDANNEIARQYGVVYKLHKKIAAKYNEKLGLSKHNNTDSDELPLGVTYLIDSSGTIQYAFIDADYRKRASIEELKAVLEKLATS